MKESLFLWLLQEDIVPGWGQDQLCVPTGAAGTVLILKPQSRFFSCACLSPAVRSQGGSGNTSYNFYLSKFAVLFILVGVQADICSNPIQWNFSTFPFEIHCCWMTHVINSIFKILRVEPLQRGAYGRSHVNTWDCLMLGTLLVCLCARYSFVCLGSLQE